jgi:DNA-binding transcriptional LysR family regulator
MDLQLSASHTIGEFLLPGWLADFRRERPDVHPQLEIVNSQGVIDAIRENRSEIGFIEGPDSPAGLQTLTVARDEIVVVVGAEHPWARRRAVTGRDLLSDSYLTREPASGTRAVATAALARAGVELIPALQAAGAQSLKRALAGGGFTLISRNRANWANAVSHTGQATSTAQRCGRARSPSECRLPLRAKQHSRGPIRPRLSRNR